MPTPDRSRPDEIQHRARFTIKVDNGTSHGEAKRIYAEQVALNYIVHRTEACTNPDQKWTVSVLCSKREYLGKAVLKRATRQAAIRDAQALPVRKDFPKGAGGWAPWLDAVREAKRALDEAAGVRGGRR